MSCMRDVLTLADAVPWDEITCTELLDFFLTGVGGWVGGVGRVLSVEGKKIPCIVLLKKALQASQEATP